MSDDSKNILAIQILNQISRDDEINPGKTRPGATAVYGRIPIKKGNLHPHAGSPLGGPPPPTGSSNEVPAVGGRTPPRNTYST
jgi:hypothetical protein